MKNMRYVVVLLLLAVLFSTTNVHAQTETTLTGRLEVFYEDDFKNPENSKATYFLNTSSSASKGIGFLKSLFSSAPKTERIQLFPSEPFEAVSGTTVRVTGSKIGNKLIPQIGKSNLQTLSRPPSSATGDQKTLVLAVRFNESAEPLFSTDQIREAIFNKENAIQRFFDEQSYGKISFSGDVYGWIDVGRSQVVDDRCKVFSPYDSDLSLFESILNTLSIDLENYDRLIIVNYFNDCGPLSNSSIGQVTISMQGRSHQISIANINQSNLYNPFEVPMSFTPPVNEFERVVIHELGHSLGAGHARGLDCDTETLGNNCTSIEYGNNFDIMGGIDGGFHFNASLKALLGWFSSTGLLDITQSGTYTLQSFERGNGYHAAKIRLNSGGDYYLEWRDGTGFNARLNAMQYESQKKGIFINRMDANSTWSYLLDTVPVKNAWASDSMDVVLAQGNQFEDKGNGMSIKVTSVTDTEITFDVDFNMPSCLHLPVVISNVNKGEISAQNDMMFFVHLQNKDSSACAKASFTHTFPDLPQGWTYRVIKDVELLPGEEDTAVGVLQMPYNSSVYDYTFRAHVTRQDTKEVVVQGIGVVGTSLSITSITPAEVHPGDTVTLKGTGFSGTDAVKVFLQNASGENRELVTQYGGNGIISFVIPESLVLTTSNEYTVQLVVNSSSVTGNLKIIAKPLLTKNLTPTMFLYGQSAVLANYFYISPLTILVPIASQGTGINKSFTTTLAYRESGEIEKPFIEITKEVTPGIPDQTNTTYLFFTWTPTETGSFILRTCTDTTNAIPESDENDNCNEVPITIVSRASVGTASDNPSIFARIMSALQSLVWKNAVVTTTPPPSVTPTPTLLATPSPTPTPTITPTIAPTITLTPVVTTSPKPTPSPTVTPLPSPSPSPTPSPYSGGSSYVPTPSPTPTPTISTTPTATPSPEPTPTPTPTVMPSSTSSPSPSASPEYSPSPTSTP